MNASQQPGKGIQRVALDLRSASPDAFDQRFACQDASCVAHQEFQQDVLGTGKLDFTGAAADFARSQVNRKPGGRLKITGKGQDLDDGSSVGATESKRLSQHDPEYF